MKEYFKRLKTHPGVGVAIVVSILGFMAGALNKSIPEDKWWMGGLAGFIVTSILAWSCVLLSNIKRK